MADVRQPAVDVPTWLTGSPFDEAVGKRIECVRMQGDELWMVFDDGTGIAIADHGQDCCEHRYMTCDDDLQSFTGARLLGAELLPAPDREGPDAHEVQFLHVRTTDGTITCETHNEHNGYYGGFNVKVRGLPS